MSLATVDNTEEKHAKEADSYEDEMERLESELPSMKFIPALSSPQPEDKWDGEIGLITEVVDKYLDNADNLEAYLCGSPGMIQAVVGLLTSKGLPEELIYYDKFA